MIILRFNDNFVVKNRKFFLIILILYLKEIYKNNIIFYIFILGLD